MAEAIDRQVNTIIVEAQARAAAILSKHKADLIAVRDELLEKKTIEGERVQQIIDDLRRRYPSDVGAPGPEVKLGTGAGTTAAEGNGVARPRAGREGCEVGRNSQVGGRRCFCFLPSPRWGEGLGVRGEVPAASQHPLTPTLSPAKPGGEGEEKV